MSVRVDELADRRRRKREARDFVAQLAGALHRELLLAYQPDHPEHARRAVARAAYERESAAWWDELRLVYRERGRWADDGGLSCE